MDWKQVLKGALIIISLLLIVYLMENGIVWVGLTIILLIIWIIASRWSNYIKVMEIVETKLYGKPLPQHKNKKELKKIYVRLTKKQKISLEFLIMLVVCLLLLIVALIYYLVRQ